MDQNQKELIWMCLFIVLPATLLRISGEFIPNIIISTAGASAG
ncbi:MAG: hypothetical protein AAFQ94_12105 [Bacteroidota bacterium]